ncbi:unnamed protein product, partial [Vitis vinifera]|uniref:Uncharacterized protein n=1 Tax=Vitis vinifera TaxID=29760 RepID=D7SMQ1_VITVI
MILRQILLSMLEALPSFHHQGLFWLDPIMIGRHSSKQILAFWLLDNSLLEDFQGYKLSFLYSPFAHPVHILCVYTICFFTEFKVDKQILEDTFCRATLLFISLINGVWLGKGMGVLDCGVGCVI